MMADTPTNTSAHVPPASASGVGVGVVGGGGGNDPSVIPQWKKELIQRRKNLAKTIGAVATQVHDSASTVAAAISASSPVTPHPRTPTGGGAFPVGSPFYAGAGTKAATSPTAAGVHFGAHFAGANEPAQQQQQRSVGGSVRTAEAVLVPPSTAAAASGSVSAGAANGPQSHSNAGSEHSGSSSSSCSSGSSTVAAAIAPATRPNSGVPVSVDRESPSVSNSSAANGVAKGSSLGSASSVGQQQQQQQQQQRDGGAARKMVAATAAEEIVVVYEKSSVLDGTVVDVSGGGGGGVGGGGGGGAGGAPGFGDAGEELKYGPGIVSRLRCRYLSLALRQSVTKQRPSLNSMRRATSLNNLLDEESEDLSEREQSIGSEGGGHQNHHPNHHHQQQHQQQHQQHHQQQQAQQKKYHSQNYHYQQQQQQQQREHYANGNGNNHNHNHNHLHQQQQQPLHATVVLQPPYQKQQPQFAPKQPWIHQQQQEEHQQQQQVVKTAAPFLRGVQNSYTRASRQVEKKNEYNRYTKHHRGGGGADAVLLKRARSVEALVRYDHHKAWERDATGPPVAAAPPTGVAAAPPVAATPVAELGSSAELGSNVIILDEISVLQATTTTTTATTATTATNNGVLASTTTQALESNGISSSGPVSGAAPAPAAMMNGATRGCGGTDLPLLVSDCVTIEEKIINGREKGDPKPKRLTSFIDADERPPPDVVKQTMKIFEANANRRGGRANGVTGGGPPGSEVASKVANYRSIIISGSATATAGATTAGAAVSAEKPPITHPKPPLSPKKPNIKPRTASPKHQAPAPTGTAAKPPPTPKSLEAVNNLKNSSNNNNGPIIASVTGQRNSINGKQQTSVAVAVESVPLLSTPPSPPARSKHATSSTVVCSNGAASVGGAVNKSMQSNGAAGGNEPRATTHGVVECATEVAANAVEAKNNALKNGGGCVRDHHNNYENGLTQTATVATASKTAGSDSGHQHTHNTVQGAAASSSSSSPPPLVGICESPSIQQLTSKLASLHLATSTPTGAGANGTTSPVNAASSAAQDRRNLEYVTSDEEEEDDDEDDDELDGERHNTTSYTVNPDSGSEQEEDQQQPQQQHPKDVRDGGVAAGSGNDADDDEDDASGGGEGEQENSDDDDGDRSVRKISRTAMENIARAGTTTQFRFNGAVKSSYLPGAASSAATAAAGGGLATAAPSTKPPAPPIPKSRESLGAKSANGAGTTGNNEANGSAGRSPSEVAGGSMASNGSAVNNNGGAGALGGVGGGAHNDGVGGGSPLTRREIEKNQINREKSGEAAASSAPGPNTLHGGAFHNQGNPGVGGASASVGGANLIAGQKLANSNGGSNSVSDSTTSFVAKWGTGAGGGQSATASPAAAAASASPLAGLVARKKTKPPPSQQDGTNTMVFNFSDRKDVPDYIENDGVIIRPRPRELPKPGESGFVVLGDLTLETSTDPDDAWAMGPPSPCNGEFANAYIVINGKSSMRNKTSRSNKFKIQFDDSLTSTYEYPSETSLLEPNGLDDADSGPDSSAGLVPPAFATDNGLLSHTNKLLSSVPLGSAPFASYTPVKAAIDTTFELGVTRTPSPSAGSTASSTGSNGSHSSSSSNSHQSATSHNTNDLQHHPHQQQQPHQQHHTIGNGHRHQLVDRPNNNGLHTSNGHSNGADAHLLNGTADPGTDGMNGTGEPESIQYLKPASDEQTVNWSQGTRVTDLLF